MNLEKNSKKADIAVTIGIGFRFLFLMSGLHQKKKKKSHPRSWGSDSIEKAPTARRGDWSRVFLGCGYFPPVRCRACETGYRQSSGLHLPLGPGGPWGPGAPGEPGKPGANEIKDPIRMQEYRSSSLPPTDTSPSMSTGATPKGHRGQVWLLFLDAGSCCKDNITITWSPRKTWAPWKPNSRFPPFSLLSSVA